MTQTHSNGTLGHSNSYLTLRIQTPPYSIGLKFPIPKEQEWIWVIPSKRTLPGFLPYRIHVLRISTKCRENIPVPWIPHGLGFSSYILLFIEKHIGDLNRATPSHLLKSATDTRTGWSSASSGLDSA